MEIVFAWLLDLLGSPVVRFADRLDSPAAAWLWLFALGCVVLFAFTPGLRLVAVGAVALLLVPSCTVAHGTGWTYASLGADATKVEVRNDTLTITDLKQADGLKHGTQALKDITRIKSMFGMGETILNKTPSIINSVQTP